MDDALPEVGTTRKVPVEQLRLDRRNPRLVGAATAATDEAIIARLYRTAELDELLQSMSANGYLDIEPLVAVAEPGENGLLVLEGNRRLATLRLLREPDLVGRINAREGVRIQAPALTERHRVTLDSVSVYRVASREAARAFLGFKHINGPAKWNAYAKARFASDWYREGQREGVSLEQIAAAIGDRHDTVKRMVSAIYVLEQASKAGLFEVDGRYTPKFSFSHLYTALSRSQYMEYLGLEAAWARHDPKPNQVAEEKLDELRNVLVWLYGSKADGVRPVIRTQNPDVKRLAEVLAHAEARHVLEETGDLNQAHLSTKTADTRFVAALIRAREAIGSAAGSLRAYDGSDKSLLDIAEDIKNTSDSVYQSMVRKRREAQKAD